VLTPQFGMRQTNDFAKVKIYTCPAYPDKRQLICYVVNAWTFNSPLDPVGSQLTGLSKLSRFQRPAETIYLADNENGSWRPIITSLGTIGGSDLRNDVWRSDHQPYI